LNSSLQGAGSLADQFSCGTDFGGLHEQTAQTIELTELTDLADFYLGDNRNYAAA
jgi:hypothetical protein